MMRGQQASRSATLLQTLVFYMGPQLLLLRSEINRKVLALAVPHPIMDHAFFAAEIRDHIAARYFAGKSDLNYTLRNAAYHKYYIFDASEFDGNEIIMKSFSKEDAEERGYFPDPGSFSRSHTVQYDLHDTENIGVRTFAIDGNWQANDFSHFHARVANLYGLFSILGQLERPAPDTAEEGYLRRLIRDRYWRGGGSYVGFYDELFDRVQNLQPLEVKSIQYQSPGKIAFSGNINVLTEIEQLIDRFNREHQELDRRYGLIYGILQQEKLLREVRGARFSTPAVSAYARREAIALTEALGLAQAEEILRACDNNTQIFCKVILSIYRRANELFTFHAEGRVQSLE